MALTPRGRDQRWLSSHRGITEQPAGSNRDNRKDGITAAQHRLGDWLIGQAWCGVWACNAALEGGVHMAKPYRWAGVANIEDDARASINGFHSWVTNRSGPARGLVLRGDLAVMFGRGVHVATFREWVHDSNGTVIGIVTDEGNTSSGPGGSQSNGGGAFRRVRAIGDVYGFARVNYPDADQRAAPASTRTATKWAPVLPAGEIGEANDDLLKAGLPSSAPADQL